jgi:hypothetical protein
LPFRQGQLQTGQNDFYKLRLRLNLQDAAIFIFLQIIINSGHPKIKTTFKSPQKNSFYLSINVKDEQRGKRNQP